VRWATPSELRLTGLIDARGSLNKQRVHHCPHRYKHAELAPHVQAVTPVPDTTCAEVDTLAGAAAGTPEMAQLGMADFMVRRRQRGCGGRARPDPSLDTP
jgi:hypothetical protein